MFLRLYFQGYEFELDTSRVRALGSPLSKGGFAAGPEGLTSFIDKTKEIMRKAEGRRLTSLELHDIICFGTYYVSQSAGRRVATISLSDLKDAEMREAKNKQFFKENMQRSVCNNSVKYLTKPSREDFNLE